MEDGKIGLDSEARKKTARLPIVVQTNMPSGRDREDIGKNRRL